jgi:hypothetical protein
VKRASVPASDRGANGHASTAAVAGLCGMLAIPAAVVVGRQTGAWRILDAEWAIPFGLGSSVRALALARGASSKAERTLERAGGRSRIRASRWLAVAGISIALAAAIAVGFYHLLLHLEA